MNVTQNGVSQPFQTVSFDEAANRVDLIDQRALPHRFEIFQSFDYRDTAAAIRDMATRGAGAIGATAAYGFAQGLRQFEGADPKAFESHGKDVFETLAGARPTAVDPVNAMRAIRSSLKHLPDVDAQKKRAAEAAREFAAQDVHHCQQIGEFGEKLIPDGARILTHCNAGWLAFVDFGSATAPIYAAAKAGKKLHVYCDETRPRLQGATLTAWELAQQGIPHTIISDNAAGHLMSRGLIDLVIVGSDRVLGKTGEVANKIGTYTKAVLARQHGIPFYVAIPLSTIDWELESGMEIPIEERDASEVTCVTGASESGEIATVRVANPTSDALNPAFDVTPADFVTGVITPHGMFLPNDLWSQRELLDFRI